MIVLDTHALIWWLSNPKKLSRKALTLIEKAKKKQTIFVSSITAWEIYMLEKKGRLKLTMDVDTWMKKIESLPFIFFVPVDNQIAAKSVSLDDALQPDSADRIIIATAIQLGATLVTNDKKIKAYKKVKTV